MNEVDGCGIVRCNQRCGKAANDKKQQQKDADYGKRLMPQAVAKGLHAEFGGNKHLQYENTATGRRFLGLIEV